MKLCTCRNCGHVFYAPKRRPFHNAACRYEYEAQHGTTEAVTTHNIPAIRNGANNEVCNTNNKV